MAHTDQKRKYTGEPYVTHCFEVADYVARYGGTPEMIAAAILHDTVEDTANTIEDIEREFGTTVAEYVGWLTDVSKPEDGNRAARKRLDREHIARAPAEAQTIKLADLISNTRSIVAHDPGFARTYLAEKALLMGVLAKGDNRLYRIATNYLEEGFEALEKAS